MNIFKAIIKGACISVIVLILAVFAIIKVNGTSLADKLNLSEKVNLGNWGGLAVFALLAATLVWTVIKHRKTTDK